MTDYICTVYFAHQLQIACGLAFDLGRQIAELEDQISYLENEIARQYDSVYYYDENY